MAALTAACKPAYPTKPCLPDAEGAAVAAVGPEKGPITLYFDASGSMAGYLKGRTTDVRPLDDLVATIPGSTSEQATFVKIKAFGRQIVEVPLKRPRADLSIVRGLPEFNDTRYKIWRMLHNESTVH